MAGMKVVVVECDQHGNIDEKDFKNKVDEHKESLRIYGYLPIDTWSF